MFTGIVEELGVVRGVAPNAGGARLEFEARLVLEDAAVGSSIAVDGCCLTVVERGDTWWVAEAVEETLRRTTLGRLRAGDVVNLERPLRPSDRLGGHVVQGHVDGLGRLASRAHNPDGSLLVRVQAPPELLRYVVEKGSIAVDGVSLTVVDVDEGAFGVALIPHTQAVTTLGRKRDGDVVNLEVDVLAKYVARLLGGAGIPARSQDRAGEADGATP
jgi:riboflavin synthase